MLNSLALIFIFGLIFSSLSKKLNLPGLVGMLFTGILFGPYVLNLLDSKILFISSELRTMALIIILLRAGLTLDLKDLKKIGRPAVLMAFLPATFEIIAYMIFGPIILGLSVAESALLGTVLAAVSPAVVVPRMVKLMEDRYGTKKGIPQLILAGASCDDVYAIVLFSTLLSMLENKVLDLSGLVKIPASVLLGAGVGIAAGLALYYFFEIAYQRQDGIRNSLKVIIILGISFFLMSFEGLSQGYFSGLIAIITMASMLKYKFTSLVSDRLANKYGKIWLAAELVLFVLVGAAVDVRYTLNAGPAALIIIIVALALRSLGVWIALLGTGFNLKEKIFCILAYLPKATVQAAIGAVPLAAGLACGKIILSVAVLSILVTAPLGAFAIDQTYERFLRKEDN